MTSSSGKPRRDIINVVPQCLFEPSVCLVRLQPVVRKVEGYTVVELKRTSGSSDGLNAKLSVSVSTENWLKAAVRRLFFTENHSSLLVFLSVSFINKTKINILSHINSNNITIL